MLHNSNEPRFAALLFGFFNYQVFFLRESLRENIFLRELHLTETTFSTPLGSPQPLESVVAFAASLD